MGYDTNRAYIPLNMRLNAPFDRTLAFGTQEDVCIALAQNTDLKALVVHGAYDTVTPYFMSRFVLEQATRAEAARKRLYVGTYPGDHMFYLCKDSAADFATDVLGSFENAPWRESESRWRDVLTRLVQVVGAHVCNPYSVAVRVAQVRFPFRSA